MADKSKGRIPAESLTAYERWELPAMGEAEEVEEEIIELPTAAELESIRNELVFGLVDCVQSNRLVNAWERVCLNGCPLVRCAYKQNAILKASGWEHRVRLGRGS